MLCGVMLLRPLGYAMDGSPETFTWVFLLGGALLALAELIVPGLVVVFLGSSGMVVGALMWLGVVVSLPVAFAVWVILSVLLILVLRRTLLRFFPAESAFTPFDADAVAFGTTVEVVEEIPQGGQGRIRHQGTTWPAVSRGNHIPAGTRVKLVYRDNLAWVVEPVPGT
jgi:inner membrane protein